MGGNRINFPGEVGTPTADLLLVKILFNSVVSTPGAKFMTMDIKDFTFARLWRGGNMPSCASLIFQKR